MDWRYAPLKTPRSVAPVSEFSEADDGPAEKASQQEPPAKQPKIGVLATKEISVEFRPQPDGSVLVTTVVLGASGILARPPWSRITMTAEKAREHWRALVAKGYWRW